MRRELQKLILAIVILLGCFFIIYGIPNESDNFYYNQDEISDAIVIFKKDAAPKFEPHQPRLNRRGAIFWDKYWRREYTIQYIILSNDDKKVLNDAITKIGWNNLFQDTKDNGLLTDVYNILPDRAIYKKVSRELFNDTSVGSIVKVYVNDDFTDLKTVLEKDHPIKYMEKDHLMWLIVPLLVFGAFKIIYMVSKRKETGRPSA